MALVRVPKEVLGAEIRAGRVFLFRIAGRAAAGGRLGGTVDAVAESGLKKAAQEAGAAELLWPDCCCKCLGRGKDLRAVRSESIANHAVAYVFRFAVPHCSVCAETASRKRAGALGMVAVGLAAALVTWIGMMLAGGLMDQDWLASGAIAGGVVAGVLVPFAWSRLRSSRGRRGSRYQAVSAASISLSATAVPTGVTLAFENAAYASRVVALNKAAGVTLE